MTDTHIRREDFTEGQIHSTSQEMPVYPHALIRNIKESDKPNPFEGDISDLNARKNYKLWETWKIFSDIRTNERFLHLLEKKDGESDDMKELKYIFVLTLDRLGRILSNTNLFDEINN